ncbi:MAG: phosphoribosylformylglycinamidine synthase subunit PurS [Acidobacteria bacterium]|nr:phosphoribosylformylglycinamidine synthase subunit PurS [Acidobacteriota bacterium]MCG3191629.1 Phosphoribosylformylglycinamidine synthase subunit PurS [Thermoanaerobaculia bacterium]
MKVQVCVLPKAGVLDPQGKAIAGALHRLGHAAVHDVRAGKIFRIDVDAETPEAAKVAAAKMAETLLSNPVIEDFEVEVLS